MTTLPLVVSRMIVFSGSLISAMGFLLLLILLADLDADHAVGIGDGAVVGVVAELDLVDILHAGDDLADDRVLAVEEVARGEHDEELRIRAVRVLRASHAD